jgi:hypothetical protein
MLSDSGYQPQRLPRPALDSCRRSSCSARREPCAVDFVHGQRRDASAAELRCHTSDREDHGATHQPQPNPERDTDRRGLSSSLRRSSPASRPSPSGWPPASLDPGCGSDACPHTGPTASNVTFAPTSPLDTAPLLQGCRSRAASFCAEDRAGGSRPQQSVGHIGGCFREGVGCDAPRTRSTCDGSGA